MYSTRSCSRSELAPQATARGAHRAAHKLAAQARARILKTSNHVLSPANHPYAVVKAHHDSLALDGEMVMKVTVTTLSSDSRDERNSYVGQMRRWMVRERVRGVRAVAVAYCGVDAWLRPITCSTEAYVDEECEERRLEVATSKESQSFTSKHSTACMA